MIRAKFPDAILNRNERPMSYWDFVNRYCKTFDNGFGIQITGGKNLTKLRDQLRGRVKRRKKVDVAKDLPEIQYEILPVEGDLKSLSENELAEVKQCLGKKDPLEELKKIGTHIASLRRLNGKAKVKSIIKWIEEANHEKIVLFAHHKAVIDELRKMEDTVYIDGSCSQKQREDAVRKFQDGSAKRLVGQIQAAGTGLTLTAANTLVFVEYSWVPAENRQAADRIHRIGQGNNCVVYFATVPNSVDEDIMNVVKRKLETYKEMGL
jgi:SWI/SNF-related matrix-associated actin-dependent regulator 1 of chromatin subfamily A